MNYNSSYTTTFGNSDTVSDKDVEFYQKVYITFLFCFGLALIFNVLILIIAKLYVDFKQHLEAYFVVTITVSDFLYALLVFVFETNSNKIYRSEHCNIFWIFYHCFTVSSFTFMFLLDGYKFFILYFPFKAIVFWSKKKVIVLIILSWSLLFIESTTFVQIALKKFRIDDYFNATTGYECQYWSYTGDVYFAVFYGCNLIPLLLSFILHILIFIIAQKKKQKSASVAAEWRNLIRRLFLVFASIIWTISIVIPARVMGLVILIRLKKSNFYYYYEGFHDDDKLEMYLWVWFAIGSMINPFVTLITRYEYRIGVKKLWRKLVNSKQCRFISKNLQQMLFFNKTYILLDMQPRKINFLRPVQHDVLYCKRDFFLVSFYGLKSDYLKNFYTCFFFILLFLLLLLLLLLI